MRIFLGIKLPEQTQQLIQKSLVKLQQKYYSANWVQPKNFHLTVCFIGEVEDYQKLIPRIEETLFEMRPFELELATGGIFQHDPLVLFIEAYRHKELEKGADKLHQVLLHRPPEYKYRPHITVGRARNPSKQQYTHMKNQFHALKYDHSFSINEITLFKSELHHGKPPSYEELETFTLVE